MPGAGLALLPEQQGLGDEQVPRSGISEPTGGVGEPNAYPKHGRAGECGGKLWTRTRISRVPAGIRAGVHPRCRSPEGRCAFKGRGEAARGGVVVAGVGWRCGACKPSAGPEGGGPVGPDSARAKPARACLASPTEGARRATEGGGLGGSAKPSRQRQGRDAWRTARLRSGGCSSVIRKPAGPNPDGSSGRSQAVQRQSRRHPRLTCPRVLKTASHNCGILRAASRSRKPGFVSRVTIRHGVGL